MDNRVVERYTILPVLEFAHLLIRQIIPAYGTSNT